VVFKVPVYTSTRPIPGAPEITIDQVTGRITGRPNEQGQFVVGVCVREFRNGVLMTTFRREFQFNVTLCEPTVNAQIQADGVAGDNQYLVNSCGDNTIDFVNLSTQERFIGDYYWEFDLNGQIDSFSSKDITVEFPGVGQYTGLMAINRGLDCSDTAYITVNVFPEIEANFSFDYDTCVAGPVTFVDSSFSGSGTITDWNWDFDGEGGSTVQGPEYQFRTPGDKAVTLSVTDVNECEDELEQVIPYYPVPPLIIVEPSSFIGCAPASIRFVNLSVPIDDSYEIIWDFGDGNIGDAISPTHIFEEPGVYDIRIDITSPIGCETSAEFPAWITVEPSPEADFDFNPKELSSFEKTVNFIDLSQRASSWQWTFDDEGVLFDQNPTFTFQDTGVHRVELIVLHPSGCPDTIVKFIDVVPVNTYYLPTAFTPNGDGRNDGFGGVGFVEGMTNFSMSIWNRWGEQVFFTEDPRDSWNGQKDNTGQVCPEAVYVYQVSYEAPRGKKEEVKGYVTLIR
jgi:gliding motility-associated-like protein